MKKTAYAALFIIAISITAHGQQFRPKADALKAPSTVVDYFLIAPLNTYLHPRYVAGSEYDARIKLLTDCIRKGTATIDEKNAYLNVRYREDDGIESDITMACFTCSDSTKLIGVSSVYIFNGDPGFRHCFLRYRGGKFIDVTGQVLPGLSFKSFMKQGAVISARMDEYIMSTTARFILPRRGTTLVVEMKQEIPYLPDCDLEFPEELYLKTYKSRILKSIEMPFNAAKGVFSIHPRR